MKNKKIEKKISNAFNHAVPDVLDNIMSEISRESVSDTSCKDTKPLHNTDPLPKKRRKRSAFFGIASAVTAAAAAAAVTLGIASSASSTAVASTISLDVNPSIEIAVNKNRRVVSVTPKTNESIQIVGDMDFSGADLEVTINALLGSMVSKGYLSEMTNSILIGVDNPDEKEAESLQKLLVDKVDSILESDIFKAAVVGQTIENDAVLRKKAADYGITLNKAQLIHYITVQHPHLEFEDLMSLNINELNLLIRDSSGLLDCKGTPSDMAYIGTDKAIECALTKAGTEKEKIHGLKVTMDYEDGNLVYEVDFTEGGKKYSYDINAINGQVLEYSLDCNRS